MSRTTKDTPLKVRFAGERDTRENHTCDCAKSPHFYRPTRWETRTIEHEAQWHDVLFVRLDGRWTRFTGTERERFELANSGAVFQTRPVFEAWTQTVREPVPAEIPVCSIVDPKHGKTSCFIAPVGRFPKRYYTPDADDRRSVRRSRAGQVSRMLDNPDAAAWPLDRKTPVGGGWWD